MRLCLGDSREVLTGVPDHSIDCVITDPPYFIDGMGSNWDKKALDKKASKAGVVGSLPVGMRFDRQQGIDFQEFMSEISRQVFRVLKPGGFYVAFSQGRLVHRLGIAIEDAGFEVRDLLIWKREGQAKAFSQDHFVRKMDIPQDEKDRILKSLGGRKTPQLKCQSEPMILAQKPKEGTFVENWMKWGVGLVDVSVSLDGKFPGTVMDVRKPYGSERQYDHVTLKPVVLIEHLVRLFTQPGQIVLDPFMGAGTTGEACKRAERDFLGIEIDQGYFEIAEKRLSQSSG